MLNSEASCSHFFSLSGLILSPLAPKVHLVLSHLDTVPAIPPATSVMMSSMSIGGGAQGLGETGEEEVSWVLRRTDLH